MTQQNIATMQDILNALDQNPDLQREFHKHVVDVIRNDDAIRQDLRKEILTEELLHLPARFTRLEEDASQLKTDVNRISGQVDNLIKQGTRTSGQVDNLIEQGTRTSGQVDNLIEQGTRTSGQVDNLIEQNTRTSGQIANLMGSDYESKAIEQSRRMVRGRLDMDSATVIFATRWDASEFEADILMPAVRAGRITRQEAEQVEAADSIVRCEDQQGNVVCAVIEISVTVQDGDRSRAAERAEIFGRATGMTTIPFVVGQEQEEAAAGSPDVPFLQYSP